ncbi:MAG TPA: Rrf2 family transcriptional regulator [Nitrospiria bacterium]|jgi:Rrf2 family protein|nr:Rrf2 family transcriptional regulator [Nitrospiria bacterium]
MLSHKAKYALKALLVLAEDYGHGPMLISDLAEREGIPKKFLEHILLELKKHGLLQSQKGKGGGYLLGKPPGSVTFGQVIRILDGPLAPVSCVSQMAYQRCKECKDEATCGVRIVMKETRDAIAEVLDGVTLTQALKKMKHVKIKSGARRTRK